MAGILSKAGAASEAAALHVGRSFFQTAPGRVVMGVLAAAAIGGGIAGFRWLRSNAVMGDVKPTAPTLEEELRVTEPTEPPGDAP